MSSERNYKRVDLMSVLAVLGVILALLFQAFFVFQIYNRTDGFLPAPVPEEPVPVG